LKRFLDPGVILQERQGKKMSNHFADRLCTAVKNRRTPLVVGLDPVYNRLPEAIRSHRQMNDEHDAAAAVDAIFDFCTQVTRVIAPLVPAVKINIAYFEKYLWEGLETFYSLISEAEDLGLEIIADVKRGDIGHTAEQYAAAHLQNPELVGLEDTITADAITINGFAGVEGIGPFADTANRQGKGIFVWVHSSNPGGAAIQDFADAGGRKLYQQIAEIVNELACEQQRIGASGYSNVGMIVGGLGAQDAAAFRNRYDKIWFLVPGFGSQGASAADCVRLCKTDGTGALITASRSIIYAYEKPQYKERFGDNWKKCIEQAVIDAKVELSNAMAGLV
jgi:orotidine-5'-phosphate decarboxylase